MGKSTKPGSGRFSLVSPSYSNMAAVWLPQETSGTLLSLTLRPYWFHFLSDGRNMLLSFPFILVNVLKFLYICMINPCGIYFAMCSGRS